jgi:peptidoglycan/LPS O-acetylase OafA/YrhL
VARAFSSNSPAKESSGWLAQLDGLRGISILMVLTAHVYAPGWHNLMGGYGVTVFFVLSGFLITRLLLQEEHDSGKINLASFYVRRAFRLFPIYYLVLAVYCLLIFGLGVHADGRAGLAFALPYYLFYLQEIPFLRDRAHFGGPVSMPFYQSWSLGIEEKFYLVWPILAFRALRNRNGRMALAASLVLFFSVAKFIPQLRYFYLYMPISWGCLIALLDDTPSTKSRLDSWVSSWRAAVVALSWPLLHLIVADHHLPNAARFTAELAYPVSIAFVILASLRSSWLARVFSLAPLAILGRYSYSIYLIHLLVRQAVERVLQKIGIGMGNGVLVYVLMLLFSTAGAGILYYAVESRFREMGRRIARSWSRRSDITGLPQSPAKAPPAHAEEQVQTAAHNVAAAN